MGIIAEKFRAGLCRIEQGVFFCTDEVSLLVEESPGTVVSRDRIPVVGLVNSDPQGWCDIDQNENCKLIDSGLIVTGGGTSWEGEGWLAAVDADSNRLLWILHLNNSEAFTSVERKGKELIAISEEYPVRTEWRIPIHQPERLKPKE